MVAAREVDAIRMSEKKHSDHHRPGERRNADRRTSSRRAHHRVAPGGHPGDRRRSDRRGGVAKKK
jgi:hypothetical protein